MLVTVSEQCDQKIMALRDEEKKGIIHAVTCSHIFNTFFLDIIGSNSGIVSHKKICSEAKCKHMSAYVVAMFTNY